MFLLLNSLRILAACYTEFIMKKKLCECAIAVCCVAGSLLGIVAPVSAHLIDTDKTISAVLHVDPGDDPVIGSPASFYFDLNDRASKFNFKECVCAFVIYQNGTEIHRQTLSGDVLPVVTYTFPERSLYKVELNGTPRLAGQFDEFSLTYDFRVEREFLPSTDDARAGFWRHHALHIALAVFLVLFAGGIIVYDILKKKEV